MNTIHGHLPVVPLVNDRLLVVSEGAEVLFESQLQVAVAAPVGAQREAEQPRLLVAIRRFQNHRSGPVPE